MNIQDMQGTNDRKRRLIGVLMIISQLTLAGFTGRWLMSQYAEEKAYLRDKLDRIYSKTTNGLVDSMIQVNLAVPLKDPDSPVVFQPTGTLNMTMSGDRPVSSRINKVIVNKSSSVPLPRNGVAFEQVNIFDSLTPAVAKSFRQLAVQLKSSAGIRLFAIRDSVRMLDLFRENLRSELPLFAGWTAPGQTAKGIVIPTDFKTNLDITGDKTYLLRKISPQIGFSALLLLLCGCAFGLSYIMVTRQMRLSAQKDSFISNMSHELKTPVSTVKVAIEALRDYNGLEDPVKTRDYLQMAGWEIDRLETLISNVLNSMQLDEGRISMASQAVDLSQLLQDISHSMQPLFQKQAKTVRLTIGSPGLSVMGDRTHLQGALYNIMDNALKYGGPDITVTAHRADGNLHITISDNGPGIPPEYSRKVFEKFFRIPSGNVHDVKGYGLGLNYTRYVIKAHAGHIHQQNNPGGGAAFIITLPV